MDVSLPEELKDFVDEQEKRTYGTSSEHVRELIGKDRDRLLPLVFNCSKSHYRGFMRAYSIAVLGCLLLGSFATGADRPRG